MSAFSQVCFFKSNYAQPHDATQGLRRLERQYVFKDHTSGSELQCLEVSDAVASCVLAEGHT